MFVLPSKGAAQLKFSRNPLASFLGTDALFHKVQSVNRKIQQATQNQNSRSKKQPNIIDTPIKQLQLLSSR